MSQLSWRRSCHEMAVRSHVEQMRRGGHDRPIVRNAALPVGWWKAGNEGGGAGIEERYEGRPPVPAPAPALSNRFESIDRWFVSGQQSETGSGVQQRGMSRIPTRITTHTSVNKEPVWSQALGPHMNREAHMGWKCSRGEGVQQNGACNNQTNCVKVWYKCMQGEAMCVHVGQQTPGTEPRSWGWGVAVLGAGGGSNGQAGVQAR